MKKQTEISAAVSAKGTAAGGKSGGGAKSALQMSSGAAESDLRQKLETARKKYGVGTAAEPAGKTPVPPAGETGAKAEKPTAEDWAGLAGNTLLAGVGQVSKTSSSLFSAAEQLISRPMGWLLGNPELYKDGPLYRMDQNVDQTMAAVQKDLAGSAAKTGKAGELVAQFGPATIAALPQAALAYLTAGQSMAAQTSTAGLQAASAAAQLAGGAAVANTVLQGARAMAANPSFQYSFLNTVGGEYQQALSDGADPVTAYAYAALSALANSAVEAGGGIDTLPEAIRGKSKGQMLEWVKGMIDEGREEVVQGAISQMMQNGVYQKGNPLFSRTNEEAVVHPGRMAEEFAGGAVVGGILGGGQMLVNNAINRSFQNEVARQIMGEDAQNDAKTGREGPAAGEGASIPVREQAAPDGQKNNARETGGNQVLNQTGMSERKKDPQAAGSDAGTDADPVHNAQSVLPQGPSSVREEAGLPTPTPIVQQGTGDVSRESSGGFSAEGREVARADARLLENLGKITGSDIRVVSQAEMDRVTGRSGAEGVQLGNRLYISEDADRPMAEVAKHELTHRLQDMAPAEYGVFRDYVAELYRADGTLEQYISGMIRSRERAGIPMTEAEALDEIAADYAGRLLVDERAVRKLAGEDRGLLERLLDGLREVIGRIKSALGGGRNAQTDELEQAARLWQDALEASAARVIPPDAERPLGHSPKASAARVIPPDAERPLGHSPKASAMLSLPEIESAPPEARFSIAYDQDNRPFVTVEEDILAGVPEKDWVRTVKDNLRKKFPNGVTVGNSDIKITGKSRNELTHSKYTKLLERTKPETYADKLRATHNTDEILRASRDYINEGLGHPRTDDISDFARGTVQLRIGGNDYTADVVVGTKTDGSLLLYDIVNLQDARINERNKPAVQGLQTEDTYRQLRLASINTLPQTSQDVKGLELPSLETGETAGRGRPALQTGAEESAPPKARFSIAYDQDNRPFVTVEEDILDGVPEKDWVRTVKDNLRKKFPNGVTVGNNQILIDAQTRREMTWSKYNQWLRQANPSAFADKLRSTNNADEILLASRDYINERLNHQRKDDIREFARGTVQLQVGGNDYSADVVVGARENGSLVLYDLLNLKPTQIKRKSQTRQTVNPSPGTGRNTVADFNGSLPQTGEDVKQAAGRLPERSLGRSPNDASQPRTFSDEVMAQLTGERAGEDTGPYRKGRAQPEGLSLPEIENVSERASPQSGDSSLSRPEGGTRSDTSEDGQFSMKGDAELQKEIDRLRRQNRRLREQMQRTDRAEMDRESVQRQARELLREYGSRYDKQTLYSRMEALYGGIANQTLSETDMRQEARSIAEEILSGNREQTNGLYEQYRDLRRELRTRGISVAPEYRADLESAGGYEGLRKRYFGKLRLGNNGTAVDQVYDDLAGRYPELFPEDIFHPADQLLRITDVLDNLQPVMGNAYENGFDGAAEYLAGELLERYFDTPEKGPTFADRQARKMAEQRAEDRRQMLEAVARERGKKEKALREMRDKYQERDRKRIENQNAAQRRETIRRHAQRLGRMLLRPTDKQHVPEELRGAALKFVQSLNLESGFDRNLFGGRVTAEQGEVQGAVPTKRSEAARTLQEKYKELAKRENFTIDPDMDGYLDELAGMGDTPLSKLGKKDLDTVWKVMRVLEHCITRSNDLLGQSRYATVSEMAEKLREDTDGLSRKTQWAGLAGKADGLLNLDMLTPETYFHKLGEAGDDLHRQMSRAKGKQTEIQANIMEKFIDAYEKSGQKFWKLEKEVRSFDTEGGTVTLTTAQVMELYNLTKREQAQEHLYTGGIRAEAVRKGLKMEGGGRAVRITPEDAARIIDSLTPEQKVLADRMQAILSTDLSAYGNEASMEVYGYEKFKEKNYWPIKIGSEDTRTDPAEKARSKTIPGYGMTKAVKPNAKNPVVLHSAIDTFCKHVTEMSTYAGWLGTNENATRLLNYQFRDAEGNQDGTVKDRLEHIHGAGGTQYLEKLLGDIAQGTKAVSDTMFSSGGMTSAFKSSAISANIRVVFQQPTAVFRAMEMVNPKYFATAFGQKDLLKGWETAKKHSPIAKWKDWGYFEMDTGRSYKELLLGPKNALGKVNETLMAPAGMADAVGWGYLWKIVEAETADKHKDLKKGSEDFYQTVAERFGEIIDRTQVVDSVLHRTQMMRSGNPLHKMASSFMSESSKQYNEIVRSVYDIERGWKEKDSGAVKKAAAHLVRTAAAMSLSFAVNALAQSLPDMWRDNDRDKSNKEKFRENWWENFKGNYNPLEYIPYVKDLWSVADSALIQKNAFGVDVSRMDMEVAQDIARAAAQAMKAHNGEGKKSQANAYLDVAAQLARAAGLPLATIKKDVIGIAGAIMQGMGNNEGLYQLDKLLYDEGNDTQRFTGHLHRAMNTDWDQYESIYQDMAGNWEQYGTGEEDWSEESFQEKIQKAMEKRMAKEARLEKTSSLPVEYTAPGVDLSFDREVMRQLTGGGAWMDALPEGTLKLARYLEGLEPEEGADSVTRMQKIRETRDSIWGDDVKDLTLSNLLGDADYTRLQKARKAGISIEKWCEVYEKIAEQKIKRTGKSGSPSQADVSAALKGSGLTERQKDVIWEGYGWRASR